MKEDYPIFHSIAFTDEEWKELMGHWDEWGDASYAYKAAYLLRSAVERGTRNKQT